MKKLFILFLIVSSAFILWRCAQQSQPQGGPKDKTAPELIEEESFPKNGEKNFKGKNVVLEFDEAVQVKNPEDIVITPPVGTKTKILAKKNKVTVYPENPWKDSTTYSISFRNSIQDLNEGNPVEDLRLAFSTGPTIDSLFIKGKISELFKDKIPEKITIAVFQEDTFDIYKHKPIFFTRSNKDGSFSINNLKAGKYQIYAFEDKNKNFKVDSKTEKHGFLSDTINLTKSKDSILINLMLVDTRLIKVLNVRNTNTVSLIRFNKPLDSITLKSDSAFIYSFGDDRAEVVVYKDFNKEDSVEVKIHATDSVFQKLDTSVYIKYTESKKIDTKFKQEKWEAKFDAETKILRASTSANKLIATLTYDSMYIQIDTTNFQPIKPSEIRYDTLLKKLYLTTTLPIDSKKEGVLNPVLILGKGALISIDQDSSKADQVNINIPKVEKTGIIPVTINTTEKHFEVQLVNSSGKVIASFRDLNKYTFNFVEPAEYKVQVIIDKNDNKKWDAGNFYKRTEPEKIIMYKNFKGSYSIPIRANWEIDPLMITF